MIKFLIWTVIYAVSVVLDPGSETISIIILSSVPTGMSSGAGMMIADLEFPNANVVLQIVNLSPTFMVYTTILTV